MLLPAHFLKMFIGTTKTTQQMIQLEFFNYDVNRLVVCFVVLSIGFLGVIHLNYRNHATIYFKTLNSQNI